MNGQHFGLAVGGLVALAVLAVGGVVVVAALGRAVPAEMNTLAMALVTGLLGLIVQAPKEGA